MQYYDALAAAEQRIVDALPAIVDSLIGRAKDGNLKATAHLLDRGSRKAESASVPPADDRTERLTEDEYERGRQEREATKEPEREELESDRSIRRLLAGIGADK